MTQQDDITQRVLTDDEIEALAKKHIAPHADRLDAILPTRVPYQQTEQFRRVKGLIVDVLSKLRAPVADERAALIALCALEADGKHADESAIEAWERARAALASAPVAVPVSPDLQAQIVALRRPDWPSTGDRSSFHEGYETARVDILRLLRRSAPVAREAHRPLGHVAVLHSPCGARYFSRITSQHQAQVCAARWAKEYANVKPGPWPTEAVAVYAAPQASAEIGVEDAFAGLDSILEVRNAALEEAAAVAKRISDKYAFGHYGNETDTADEIEREIMALKQPQADKGGAVDKSPNLQGSSVDRSTDLQGRGDDVVLPPLPSPPVHRGHALFAGSQMQTYARAAVLADRQQRAENARSALTWYAEQVAGCRKLGPDGDAARNALDTDGGQRARAALSAPQAEQGERKDG